AADLAAMGAAVKLLIAGPAPVYVVVFTVASLVLQVYVPFERYSPYLKVLTLTLFAYVATVLMLHVPWGEVARETVMPHVRFNADYATAIVAVLGTTISPYLFFWQTSQECQEVHDRKGNRHALKTAPAEGRKALFRINLDTV